MTIKEELQKEFEEHKDELVLNFLRVGKFVGINEDEWDHYYMIKYLKGCGNSEIEWESAVGKIIFLKDYLTKKDYNMLNHVYTLNDPDEILKRTKI